MKKIIIFDMDGVLFDSIDIAERYIISQYLGLTKEMTKELLCGNYYEEIKKISLSRKVETEQEKVERKKLYSKIKSTVSMYRGARELLEEPYKDGYILILNTSASNHNSLPLLECSGIGGLFDFLATAEISRSKVEKFKIIKDKYKVHSTDLLFITDTLGDIKEADIANVPTVAVTWGAHDESYFNREHHKNLLGIIRSFNELKKFIEHF